MKAKLQISEVENISEWLQLVGEQYIASQSISWLRDHIGELCSKLAFVNNQMAISRFELNTEKKDALQLVISMHTHLSPSLVKEYSATRCAEQQYQFDLCERTSRTITHTIEALRTCISALKEEIKTSNYPGQI